MPLLLAAALAAQAALALPGRRHEPQAQALEEGFLERENFASLIDAPEEPAAREADLRDAPRALAAPPSPAPPLSSVESGQAALRRQLLSERLGVSPERRPLSAGACDASARNLRFVVGVAQAEKTSGALERQLARKKLASGLTRELESLRRLEAPDDAQVALWATDAQMELEGALMTLEDPKLTVSGFRSEVLGAASRAAAGLEAAARKLSPPPIAQGRD
ncbi:MAG: hypothetical protein HY554_02400 [Elusimicrobia bacterium]|nr:hypothetical protein [Elusimicrobiota bacterium]